MGEKQAAGDARRARPCGQAQTPAYTRSDVNQALEDLYRTGRCVDLAGKERKVTGAVPREDALILQDMVSFVKAKTVSRGHIGLNWLGGKVKGNYCVPEARPKSPFFNSPNVPLPLLAHRPNGHRRPPMNRCWQRREE